MVGAELVTYWLNLIASALTEPRYALENIGEDGGSVQIKFGLERDKSVAAKYRHAEHTLKT